jgi:hypothetical protein
MTINSYEKAYRERCAQILALFERFDNMTSATISQYLGLSYEVTRKTLARMAAESC